MCKLVGSVHVGSRIGESRPSAHDNHLGQALDLPLSAIGCREQRPRLRSTISNGPHRPGPVRYGYCNHRRYIGNLRGGENARRYPNRLPIAARGAT